MSFILPSERSKLGLSIEGWDIMTDVQLSGITDSGHGRYARENVPANKCIMSKTLMPMASIIHLSDVSADSVVTFASEEDLERYITLAMKEGDLTRDQIIDFFANFLWGLDGKRGCLNISTYTVNHANRQNANIEFNFENVNDTERVLGTTINAGLSENEEITCDYGRFKLPNFYLDFCKKHNFIDVRTNVMNIVNESQAM